MNTVHHFTSFSCKYTCMSLRRSSRASHLRGDTCTVPPRVVQVPRDLWSWLSGQTRPRGFQCESHQPKWGRTPPNLKRNTLKASKYFWIFYWINYVRYFYITHYETVFIRVMNWCQVSALCNAWLLCIWPAQRTGKFSKTGIGTRVEDKTNRTIIWNGNLLFLLLIESLADWDRPYPCLVYIAECDSLLRWSQVRTLYIYVEKC